MSDAIIPTRRCKVNLVRAQIGYLTVMSEEPPRIRANGRKERQYLCRCICGKELHIDYEVLRAHRQQSCGCLKSQLISQRKTRHGLSHTKVHQTWIKLRQRCNNPTDPKYPDYGGRGITVCERWNNSFDAFYEDMGDPPSPQASIHRKDNDGPYSPENCQWATRREQANNTRASKMITFQGRTMTIAQWATAQGISTGTLWARLKSGWSIEHALTEPKHAAADPRKCRRS